MYTTNSWEAMVYGGVGSKHTVKPLPVFEGEAIVVDIRRRERDADGEGYEGDSGSGYVIFQVGDRFFKKSFSESSFSDEELYFYDYDKPVEVFGTVETTIAFRPKER